ncbi:MAG: hypothetical protein QM756_35105 [Polyangiaceae bacterium]
MLRSWPVWCVALLVCRCAIEEREPPLEGSGGSGGVVSGAGGSVGNGGSAGAPTTLGGSAGFGGETASGGDVGSGGSVVTSGGSGGAPSDGGAAGSNEAGAGAGGVGPELPCPGVPDPTKGVFVSSGITQESDDCGSADLPCRSITRGITRALQLARRNVYVNGGSYPEAVTLPAGITVIGGYDRVGLSWEPRCTATRASAVVIDSPSAIGVLAEYVGDSELRTLTVRAQSAPGAGESRIGVLARGASTALTLSDVNVIAGDAGAGANGAAGAAVAAPTMTCTMASDGADATNVGADGAPAAAGSFDATGFKTAVGVSGGAGEAGHNGAAGQASCVTCSQGGQGCVYSPPSCTGADFMSCGAPGIPGCGGVAGNPGLAGKGGGSSVGLLVWRASVHVLGGSLSARAGGPGGAGGDPSDGSLGGTGAKGADDTRCVACEPYFDGDGYSCAQGGPVPGGVGGVGTAGGKATRGGKGGSGASGHSYALVHSASTTVDVTSTRLVHATAAAGNAGGLAGAADNVFTAPE